VQAGDPVRGEGGNVIEELLAFIEARLADDEAVAHRYRPDVSAPYGMIESWVADRRWNNETPPYYDYRLVRTQLGAARSHEVVRTDGGLGDMVVMYIARFGSPARVLADTAAKRALVALHRDSFETLQLVAMTWMGHPEFDPAWAFECELRENSAGKIVLKVVEDGVKP
jgi:hypothetical protein